MLWSDLRELKSMLEIDPEDTSEDVRLNFWLKAACGILEDYLGYGVYRMERTEYPKGSGTSKLVLRTHPVHASPEPQVWVDESGRFSTNPNGAFAATTKLTYGSDFNLWLDEGTGSLAKSTRGILLRNGGIWNKSSKRQLGYLSPYVDDAFGTIKVVYTGGYYAEDLPQNFVLAAVQTTARIRFMMPLGLDVTSDSYDGRSINIKASEKNWLIGQVKHLIHGRKNRRF